MNILKSPSAENYSIARTNDCISNEIERPLKVIGATATLILQSMKGKKQFQEVIEQMQGILSCSQMVLYSVADLRDVLAIKKRGFSRKDEIYKTQQSFLEVMNVNYLIAKQMNIKLQLNFAHNLPTIVRADKMRV